MAPLRLGAGPRGVAGRGLCVPGVRTLKGAIAGLALGVVGAVIMAIAGNLLLTPAWLGVPLDAVVAMIVPVLVPFNALKAVLNAVLGAAVYRAVRPLLDREGIGAGQEGRSHG